jgi:3-deoxy-manno-octulosonate cytidylyltransferase (CMP-KDO synthetase)
MKICCIIPARYNSKRLPGKPLLKINNKELLSLTYKVVNKVIKVDDIYIFTDSKKILSRFENIKNIFMFKNKFLNGTERASYGVKYLKKKYSAAIILSCDNPFLNKKVIIDTIKSYNEIKNDNKYCASTVHCKNIGIESNKNIAKVVLDKNNDILYISRSQIPYKRINNKFFYTHHGPVCVKIKFLKKYIYLKNTPLQKIEDNEWLKFIESGYKIRSRLVKKIAQEINIKEDLSYYRSKYK